MTNLVLIIVLVLGLSYLVILLKNNVVQNKIIKYLFVSYSLIFLIFIIMLDNNFIYIFLKNLITYLWYPTYLIFVITVIINIIYFVYTLLSNKISIINKTINCCLFIISFGCYVVFLSSNIDPTLYSSLYSTLSLSIMRINNISFLLGKIFNFLMKKIGGKHES